MSCILFVCSANKDRSKTAEEIFSKRFTQLHFLSAGTNHALCIKENSTPLTQQLIDQADLIFLMENKHLDWVYNNLNGTGKKMIVLNIPDNYSYFSKELRETLEEKCTLYLENI